MLKRDIITWLKQQVRYSRNGHRIEVPCVDGMEAAITYLEEQPALTGPVLPEEPTEEMLVAIYNDEVEGYSYKNLRDSDKALIKRRYKALRAELMKLPKPKTRTVWMLAFTTSEGEHRIIQRNSESGINRERDAAMRMTSAYSNVSTIWSQEVPA